MNTTKTNQELSEYEIRWLISEELNHTIRSTENNLFNYWPFPNSTAVEAFRVGSSAHLSIELSMKFLLKAQGKETKKEHNLAPLLDLMSETTTTFLSKEGINTEALNTEALEKAFEAAISLYQIDSRKEGMCHTKSLKKYLCKTGSAYFFNNNIRYWPIEKPDENKVEEVVKLVPAIHLELLYVMRELLDPFHDKPWTVNDRVEHKVILETTGSARAELLPDDGTPDCAAGEFKRWIGSQGTLRDAMAAAIKQDFQISAHPEINELMRAGYENLKKQDDTAVRFFVDQAKGRMHFDPILGWGRGPIPRGKDGKP